MSCSTSLRNINRGVFSLEVIYQLTLVKLVSIYSKSSVSNLPDLFRTYGCRYSLSPYLSSQPEMKQGS